MFIYQIDADLHLQILEERHAEDLFYITDLNRQHIRQFLMWADDIHSVSDSLVYIRDGLRQFADNNGFQCGIWYQNELIGCIGFHRIDWNNRNTEIGYWLARPYTGKGIVTRACAALLDYAFNVWRLHRVEIRCAANNVKSRAIPERLGFIEEGVKRQEIWLHDHYADHVVYGILANEWRDFKALKKTS
ncbi:MAG: GNAT family N-acetyltransferase [Anaerolineae bacterium]|jgi:ribosomal-protein-serine acetyltransferase|nr:GNAT family N-acetyltransferase [Anaerolineae bacterium]